MTATDDETALINRARQGDRDAFGALVRLHEVNIRRLAAGILLDPVEAEDAAQEVFVKAWQALGRFRGDAAFSTWLHRIAINHCRDISRARSKRRWLSWDGLVETLGGREPVEAAGPADATTRGTDARDSLRDLLGGLPAGWREILVLREVEGLSYVEIAETLDTTEDSVRAKLKRAREAVRDAARHERTVPDV
ncbi:MAG: RNA polymerase sigma factor [Candidatus Coatesbacteria bacterium]